MITVYGIKNCDSVKKALKFFDTHGIHYQFIDFKTSPVDFETIKRWNDQIDLSLLMNAKGTTYRTLNLKSLELNNQQKIEWMAKENLLIKRPVVEYTKHVIVGFNLSQYEGTFLS